MIDHTEAEQRIAESARMNDDGTLGCTYVIVQPGMSPGHSIWTAEPQDPDFEEIKSRHGITKPGQRSTIIKELRDGVWKEWQEKEGDWT
ncbi:MAG TPA: hypothetical protein V6C89_07430 [Drouetiella sp.]|jgi:hypothetical protein